MDLMDEDRGIELPVQIQKSCNENEYKELCAHYGFDKRFWMKNKHIFLKEVISLDSNNVRSMMLERLKKLTPGNFYNKFSGFFDKNSQKCINRNTKNAEASAKARTIGNELFNSGFLNDEDYKDIRRWYSEAIALAPPNSELLALGYGNRSCLTLTICRFKECLMDINRAVALTSSNMLKIKLLCRKMTCFGHLGIEVNKKEELWREIESLVKLVSEKDKNDKFNKMVKKAKKECAKFPLVVYKEKTMVTEACSASGVKVNYSEESGQHLVASRDLQPGEIIFAQKPYVTSVNTNQSCAHCCHCIAPTWCTIPCDHCSLNMYCSEQCKDEAWKQYHDIECKMALHMQFNDVNYYFYQIAVKIIIMGVKEAGSITALREEIEKFDKSKEERIKFFTDQCKSGNINTFKNFYNLSHKCAVFELEKLLKGAFLVMTYFVKASNLFGSDLSKLTGNELSENEDVVFVLLLALRFIAVIHSNSEHHMLYRSDDCLVQNSIDECLSKRCCSIATSVNIYKYTLKYDCNPNAAIVITQDGKTILLCLQPIPKDEQISLNNFDRFYEENKFERQMSIHKRSHYFCQCQACRENWPTLPVLKKKFELETAGNHRDVKSTLKAKMVKLLETFNKLLEKEDYRPGKATLIVMGKDIISTLKNFEQPSYITCQLIEMLEKLCIRMYEVDSFEAPRVVSGRIGLNSGSQEEEEEDLGALL